MISVGLIKGRHPLPVEEYILDSVEDVLDFNRLHETVFGFIKTHCNPTSKWGIGVNQLDHSDVKVATGDDLDVYVTGLSAATAEVVASCAEFGINLRLWHFDRDTGNYVPQCFWFGGR